MPSRGPFVYTHPAGWEPPCETTYRRGCHCRACTRAHQAWLRPRLARDVTVDGRTYNLVEQTAIGHALGAPGGVASPAEIRRWAARAVDVALADAIHGLAATARQELESQEESPHDQEASDQAPGPRVQLGNP